MSKFYGNIHRWPRKVFDHVSGCDVRDERPTPRSRLYDDELEREAKSLRKLAHVRCTRSTWSRVTSRFASLRSHRVTSAVKAEKLCTPAFFSLVRFRIRRIGQERSVCRDVK